MPDGEPEPQAAGLDQASKPAQATASSRPAPAGARGISQWMGLQPSASGGHRQHVQQVVEPRLQPVEQQVDLFAR